MTLFRPGFCCYTALMKIMILNNQAKAMSNFWSVLIRELKRDGHQVLCLCPATLPDEDNTPLKALSALGADLRHYPLDRKGLKPWRDLKTLLALRRIMAEEKPDRLFSSSIKPVIYGSLAAALAGRPRRNGRFSMITGLGYMFEADTPIKRALRLAAVLLYRLAFRCNAGVFFQNRDDYDTFKKLGIIPKKLPVHMSRGTGVDLERFSPAPLPNDGPRFLLIGRLLEAKGLREFYQAAKTLRPKYPKARFCVLGPPEEGLGSVPVSMLRAWQDEGIIEYLGQTQDVRPFIAEASAIVLPSYREGTPCAILEGMSMARPAVATDVPGCRETVINGQNGWLVPAKDAPALAAALERLIQAPDLALEMGRAGRKLAEQEFDAVLVARKIIQAMRIRRTSDDSE